MELNVLGCGGGLGSGEQTTSLLLDESVLLDAGSGIGTLDIAAMTRLRAVFLTHSHMDHICYLPFLADTLFGRLDFSLPVIGREETIEALRAHVLNNIIWPDFTNIPAERPVLRLQTIAPGETVTVGHLRVTAIEVPHVVPALGYYVTDGVRHFAFSGDTTVNDSFWPALNALPRLDTLIMEAAFADKDAHISRLAQHYSPGMLAGDMAKLEHDPVIYLSHPKPGFEQTILDECRGHMPERDLRGLSSGDRITV